MADQRTIPRVRALRRLEASLQSHFCDQLAADSANDRDTQDCLAPYRLAPLPRWRQLLDLPRRLFEGRPKLRKGSLGAASVVRVPGLGVAGLWWRPSRRAVALHPGLPLPHAASARR